MTNFIENILLTKDGEANISQLMVAKKLSSNPLWTFTAKAMELTCTFYIKIGY